MKVVSNTSPLCYLLLIEQADLLPKLFGEIIIPEAVSSELRDEGTPEVGLQWIIDPPTWLHIVSVSDKFDSTLNHLHRHLC